MPKKHRCARKEVLGSTREGGLKKKRVGQIPITNRRNNKPMKIKNQVILVTGANRGIGKALVQAALQRGASKVYAAARKPSELPDFGDARVVPLTLDVTLPEQVAAASQIASDVSLLINNAGALAFASVLDGEFNALENDMSVNYFGTLRVTRAFAPALIASRGGVASISSIVGLASMAAVGGYSASKAALFSAIQAMRAEFKKKNVAVFGIFPGPIDTDMAKEFEMDKTSPGVTAENILDGIEAEQEDIFPDPMAVEIGKLWASDPKQLERNFASM